MAGWGEWRDRVRVALWLLAYGLACGAFIAVRHRSVFLGVVAVFGIVGAARNVQEAGRTLAAAGASRLRWRVARSSILVVAGLALAVAWRAGAGDGWGFFGIALLYLGLGLVLEQLRADDLVRTRLGPPVLAGATVLALAGLVATVLEPAWWTAGLAIAAVLAAPVGITLVAESLLVWLDERRLPAVPLAAVGLALYLIGLVAMVWAGIGPFVWAAAVALAVLALALVARSNADVVLVVAMAAVVWTMTHRSVPAPEYVVATEGESVLVALGDSYISGEGAEEFYEGTNDKGDDECRRAPTAYPALLVLEDRDDLPDDLLFLACSGAKADGVRDQLAELRRAREERDLDVELVLLSVGGNDALFGSIGRTCVLPGDCGDLGGAWTANLDRVDATLRALYADVRAEVGDGVPVLVVPYPVPIRERGCTTSGFTGGEHRFLHDFTLRLDEVVSRAATDAGFLVVDTMPTALDGHRLCDARPESVGVNFLSVRSVFGTLEQSVNPLNWFHNSMHPNARGHELMRAAVLRWLDDNAGLLADARSAPSEGAGSDGAPPPMPEPAAAVAGDECLDRAGGDLEECTSEWQVRELARLLLARGPLAVVTLVGALLVAVALVHLRRDLFARPPGPADGPGAG